MSNKKTIGKLERRYARAMLSAVERELGRDGAPSPAQHVAAALGTFAQTWENEPLLSETLLNPMFEKGERQNALAAIARASHLPDIVIRFLRVCFERDRLAVIPGIAAAFAEEAERAVGIVSVEVITAQPVVDDERAMIQRSMESRIRGTLRFSWGVDRSLLGGMVVRYQGKVLDGSVVGRLAQVERRLGGEV